MGTTLSTLAPTPGATRKRKRVGRGPGSGIGKTSGRGQKGQNSRSGTRGGRVGFEGGQMPMQRRLPKRGFVNQFRVETHPINLDQLERFDDGEVTFEMMRDAGLLPKKAMVVKILGRGEITKKLTVIAHRFSKTAVQKLEAAGGSAQVVSPKTKASSDAPVTA